MDGVTLAFDTLALTAAGGSRAKGTLAAETLRGTRLVVLNAFGQRLPSTTHP